MESLIFDGTIYFFVEVHLCKTTGPLKRDLIQSFDRLAYQYIFLNPLHTPGAM